MWSLGNPLLAVILWTAALVAAYQAMRTASTPQGAAGWVVFILALPPVAIPLYFLFGFANYRSYSAARRTVERIVKSDEARPDSDAAGRLAVFERLGDQKAEGGNGLDLLIDAEATYDALLEAITAAERYLLLEFYTIRADATGERFFTALCEKARQGVAVYLLHDAFRGVGLPRRYEQMMRKAGVRIRAPRAPRRAFSRFQINFRSHRKMLVADGTAGFTGGLNIGDEYLGLDPRIGAWRDTFIRVKGPVVTQLQRTFFADWRWTTGEEIEGLNWDAGRDPRDMRGLVLSPAPTDRLKTGNLYFCAMAAAARRRLWIASPYFVPDTEVLAALKLASLRGVEVRILVPDKPDHRLPWLAAFAFFDDMLDSGAEIWRYTGAFMHQKVILADDDLVSIGTINLDVRSGLLNFEQTVILSDRTAASMTAEMLEADFARAYRMGTRLDDQPLARRVLARASRLLAPVL